MNHWFHRMLISCLLPLFVYCGKPDAEQTAVPAKDPKIKQTVSLTDAVKGKHPRLLFTADDIPRLKAFAQKDGARFFERMAKHLPNCVAPTEAEPEFLRDATEGQANGLWRAPVAGLHYVLTGDKMSYGKALAYMQVFLAQEHWELGEEQDLGMSSANIMAGAALLYDWMYNDLDPVFRDAFRKKLLLMARRQYYRGHMGRGKSTQYWQNDPANNHRWHRDAGLTLAVLAIAGEGEPDAWILEKTAEELAYITTWLPPDGTSHESPSYIVFGLTHLCLAVDAADRCLGTSYLKLPFFANVPLFRLYTFTPGMQKTFGYGDSGERAIGPYHSAFFRFTSVSRDSNAQAGLVKLLDLHPGGAFPHAWFSLVWFDPTLTGGKLEAFPQNKFFGDMGLAFMRDGWEEENVGMLHKCSPYGGYLLNKYRNANDFHYINVAHDDPDANEIIIYAKKMVFVKPDGYSHHKHTAAHNTILVNGKGQIASDSSTWTQPPEGVDLTTLSYMTTWKDNGDGLAISEGEAGNAYAGIDRYRRSTIWVPGKYILLIDDIGGKEEAAVQWLMQGAAVDIVDRHKGRYRFIEQKQTLDFNVSSVQKYTARVIDSPAADKEGPIGYKQLRLSSTGKSWSLATVFNTWDVKGLSVTCKETKAGLTVTVTGKGFKDVWTYGRTADMTMPSAITGQRGGKVLITCGPEDRAPRE